MCYCTEHAESTLHVEFLVSRVKADNNDYEYNEHNARATDDKRLSNDSHRANKPLFSGKTAD